MSTHLTNQRRAWSWRLACGAAGLAAFTSDAAAQRATNEVLRWNTIATQVSAAAGTDPLTESRVFAMLHLAMHDAVNAVDRRYEPYRALEPVKPGTSAAIAAASAAHTVLVSLMPAAQAAADEALTAVVNGSEETGVAWGLVAGRAAATRILTERKNDGARAQSTWKPVNRPGHYQSTPPENLPAALTHWGRITPFALRSAAQFRPLPHPSLSSAAYAADLAEVRAIGRAGSASRTAEQTEIAKYWYEHSTQGWNRIAREVAEVRGLDLWDSARLFALVNVAMADGFIGGFEAKYYFDFWRPVTAIREAANDGNAATAADPNWLSELSTPPVPDYPSTHTVLGAAAAAVLARVLETDFIEFSMTSGAPYAGITRRFWSFSEAARENGASRVLAGIHFQSAVRAGYLQGEAVGAWTVGAILRPVRSRLEETATASK
jgi:membrane-associated phospholipid phosphatase